MPPSRDPDSTTSARPESTGHARLARIEGLLASDPGQAESEAGRLLAEHPDNAMARLFQGIARRLLGNPTAAIDALAPLTEAAPDAPLPHLQLGLALREAGDKDNAVASMRRAVAVKPDFSDGWLALADLLHEKGEAQEADQAFGSYLAHSSRDFPAAAAALSENRTADAEGILRQHLEHNPTDVRALCMLADVALRHARYESAGALLERCLHLAPSYRAARHNYAVVLMRRERPAEALREVERLLSCEPADSGLLTLKAACLQRLGDYEAAIAVYESILATQPDEPGIWASLGHTLRTVGRLDECVEAYRKAASLAPGFGEAYWNLANLKTFRFRDSELQTMQTQLANPELGQEDRVSFNFAVGKALEDRGAFEDSFRHYAEGNRLRRRTVKHDAEEISSYVRRCKSLFTADFFAQRAAHGDPSADPVFIVGLPRSGSTLVEQILASHSAVEGTMELSHVDDIVKSLAGKAQGQASYPELLSGIGEDASRELGGSYLERARVQRRQGTPLFIDKMPNNFLHIGLIHLILPNARIVDVRRNAMACGWSVFKHLFAHGHHFSYSQQDIGRYYRDYVALTAHFDAVLPGRVHRIGYEALVNDPDAEIRRLLAYCKLPFEENCLKFFENPRAVSTPSSEQVRMPIFRDALDQWKNFEACLAPLKAELEQAVGPAPESV